ncbi:MAG: tetratricopeptide repeat protein [Balneolaceae bacterium]
MITLRTRMAGLMLAFGFFFFSSCTLFNHTVEDSETRLQSGNPESALSEVNRVLEEDGHNEDALLLKAEILAELARMEDSPDRRENYYREMRETLSTPGFEPSGRFRSRRDQLSRSAWNREQEAGLRLLQQENARNYRQIVSHFENAIVINPDSSTTYSLKATTHYSNGDLRLAIETLETGRNRILDFPADYSEKLAFLYLEEGQLEQSASLYRYLLDRDPDNTSIRDGLINAHILAGNHHESVPLLRELAGESPENIHYQESLVTELVFRASGLADSLSGVPSLSEADADELIRQLEEAEQMIRSLIDRQPSREEFTYAAAALYKNSAQILLSLSDSEHVQETLADSLRERSNHLLHTALPLWETVAERNPENREIWNSLYQIYTQLGMSEEAEATRSRINL